MKKVIFIIAILVVVVGGVFFVLRDKGSEEVQIENQNNVNQATPAPTETVDPNIKTFTLDEVAKHGGSKTYDDTQGYETYSCWMVIHDKVYDVTDFIEPHPGGHIIEEGCGTDATELFETRPQGSGTPHSTNARNILEKYYIGELKK
jgi:cytochrome b involved in lipid metabolism